MGGPLSVTFCNSYLTKLGIDKIRRTKLLFYKCFVDDVMNRRKKNTPDSLLTLLNCYHPNIKFTVENTVKRFLGKLQTFVHHNLDIAIKWSTKKIRSLFWLKDKNPHPACKIDEGICSCSANYISETKRNVETQWNEQENPNKDSEPAKHQRKFPDHKFDWKILLTAPTNAKLCTILESSMIALKQPSLNEQIDFDKLILFRNGVT